MSATSLLLIVLATPLVLSVHSVVSFDFAVSQLPGWHTTIFPPYFVAGAISSGFAMVLTLLIPARELYPGMKDFVTARTIENMCKIITVTGSMVENDLALGQVRGRHPGIRGGSQHVTHEIRLGLAEEDRHDRGRVDHHHAGMPSSS